MLEWCKMQNSHKFIGMTSIHPMLNYLPSHAKISKFDWKFISNLKIVVYDVMERIISFYIEANDEKMEELSTQNVHKIVKGNIQLIPFHIKKNGH